MTEPANSHRFQEAIELKARQGPFVVLASLMFDVQTRDVTLAQYAAAIERTWQCTAPQSRDSKE